MTKFSPLQEENNEIKIDFIDNQIEHKIRIYLRSPTNANTEYFIDPKITSVIEFKKDVRI